MILWNNFVFESKPAVEVLDVNIFVCPYPLVKVFVLYMTPGDSKCDDSVVRVVVNVAVVAVVAAAAGVVVAVADVDVVVGECVLGNVHAQVHVVVATVGQV